MFGQFVDMDLVFNNLLVHHILQREVRSKRKDAMSFDIRGTVMAFFKEEFLLVIKLLRIPAPRVLRENEPSMELERQYFDNNLSATLRPDKLEEKYKDLTFEIDENFVRVTLVYYIEVAMMRKNKQKSCVDRTLFEDVEDLKYYNSMD